MIFNSTTVKCIPLKKSGHPLLTDAQIEWQNENIRENHLDPLNDIYHLLVALSEKLPTKRERVWTNCGSICTMDSPIEKTVSVKSARDPPLVFLSDFIHQNAMNLFILNPKIPHGD